MKIKDVQQKKEIKSSLIAIRIKPSIAKWIKKNKLSPTKIFETALEELGCPK